MRQKAASWRPWAAPSEPRCSSVSTAFSPAIPAQAFDAELLRHRFFLVAAGGCRDWCPNHREILVLDRPGFRDILTVSPASHQFDGKRASRGLAVPRGKERYVISVDRNSRGEERVGREVLLIAEGVSITLLERSRVRNTAVF